MAKRYPDCQFSNSSPCNSCSLSNYGRDCRNSPINPIAHYREAAGLSQRELGELIGIEQTPQQRISEWERGYRVPTAKHLSLISKALNVTIEELLEE